MNVLFLMISFPDINKDSNLYSDLAEEFRNNGHQVYVATLLHNYIVRISNLLHMSEVSALQRMYKYTEWPKLFFGKYFLWVQEWIIYLFLVMYIT